MTLRNNFNYIPAFINYNRTLLRWLFFQNSVYDCLDH